MSLHDVLDSETVARLAGPRSFARGRAYAQEGAVARLEVTDERIEATVHGTQPYRVRIGTVGGRLSFACSCPVGDEGAFCKHRVAVALRWLEQGAPGGPDLDTAGEHLRSLGVERLVELLLEHAREDERLAKRLATVALRAAGGPVDVVAYRALIDRATAVHGYVGYREAWAFFSGVDEALDALAALLEAGHAAEVAELAEHALAALDATCGYVDDSDGGTIQAIERVEQLHHAACAQAPPDLVALAERLFGLTLGSENELLSDAIEQYADVLGDAGVARYRALVEAEWAKLPTLGRDEPSGRYGVRRGLVSSMMERLARLDGDVDRLVEIKASDLADDWAYLQIAELHAAADASRQPKRGQPAPAWARHDRSTLVEIFLWEDDVAAAWEQAQAAGCDPALWRRLAAARAADRPKDALAVYRMLIGRVVGATNNAAYQEAVELLGELEQLLEPHDCAGDHARLVAEVREVNHRKRNLLKLLDQRWPVATGR